MRRILQRRAGHDVPRVQIGAHLHQCFNSVQEPASYACKHTLRFIWLQASGTACTWLDLVALSSVTVQQRRMC